MTAPVTISQFFAHWARGAPPFAGAVMQALQNGHIVDAETSNAAGVATVTVAAGVTTTLQISLPKGCVFQSDGKTTRTIAGLMPHAPMTMTRINVAGLAVAPAVPPVPPVPVVPAYLPAALGLTVANLAFEDLFR